MRTAAQEDFMLGTRNLVNSHDYWLLLSCIHNIYVCIHRIVLFSGVGLRCFFLQRFIIAQMWIGHLYQLIPPHQGSGTLRERNCWRGKLWNGLLNMTRLLHSSAHTRCGYQNKTWKIKSVKFQHEWRRIPKCPTRWEELLAVYSSQEIENHLSVVIWSLVGSRCPSWLPHSHVYEGSTGWIQGY